MAAWGTTLSVVIHNFARMDAPSSAVKLHFLSGVRTLITEAYSCNCAWCFNPIDVTVRIVLERFATFQHYYLMQVYPPILLMVTVPRHTVAKRYNKMIQTILGYTKPLRAAI